MEKELKIKTSSSKEEAAAGGDPVSPTGQYLNSSVLSLTVFAVLEFEVPLDDLPIMDIIRHVFLPVNPRFSSIMKWQKKVEKVEVNLDDHVVFPTFPSNLSADDQCYDEHFNEYLEKVVMDPLPQNRPLWEAHVVKYPTTKAAGHIIAKLHHALGDGYSLMATVFACLKRADDPSLPLTFPSFRRTSNQSGWCTRIVTSVPKAIYVACNTLCDYGWSMLKSSVLEDDKSPIKSGNENLEHKPMGISTVEFSLDKIKQIKVELGVTINDIVTGIIYHGTRLYMRGRCEKWASSHVTTLVLMNTRNVGGYKSVSEMIMPNKTSGTRLWGNHFAFLHTSVPTFSENDDFPDPLEFVFQAKRIIQQKRRSLAFKLIAQTIEFVRRCAGPEAAAKLVHKTMRNASLGITNMVGPIEKMTLADYPVKGLYFIVAGPPLSLQITVLSYTQTLRIGIGVEKNFIDLLEFKSCVEQAFEMTFDAATKKGR